jgi:hypothetical protein
VGNRAGSTPAPGTEASSKEEAFFVFHHLLKHTSSDFFCDFICFSVS